MFQISQGPNNNNNVEEEEEEEGQGVEANKELTQTNIKKLHENHNKANNRNQKPQYNLNKNSVDRKNKSQNKLDHLRCKLRVEKNNMRMNLTKTKQINNNLKDKKFLKKTKNNILDQNQHRKVLQEKEKEEKLRKCVVKNNLITE